ncbi:MAG: hypothetical protein IKE91_00465 [Clostridia bacterium]|nr:hypothetical protein [Clostridia bacterium]
MSEADKMFKELDYKKEEDNNYILFRKELLNKEFKIIVFNLNKALIDIRTEDDYYYQTITTILNMQELKAINEKCRELGWLE